MLMRRSVKIFSQIISRMINKYISKPYIPDLETINLPNFSVRDMNSGHKLIKLLIYDDDTRWREILDEVVKKAFNITDKKYIFENNYYNRC